MVSAQGVDEDGWNVQRAQQGNVYYCTPTDHLHSQLADLEYQKAKAVLESNQTSGDLSMYNR